MQILKDFANINGTRIYFEMAGVGHPLVLIHGHTFDTRMWDAQFEQFARRYQVIRYDMRGYGRSAMPTEEHYAPADDLMALLAYLRLGHAHIIGLSRGGEAAIDFALKYPSATDTLIAVASGVRGFEWQSFGEFNLEVQSTGMASGLAAGQQHWLGGPLFTSALQQPEVAAHLEQIVSDYSGWHWFNNEMLHSSDPPAIQQLVNINIPTLVVIGERDIQDFQAIADILHLRIPRAAKVIIPGVGHVTNMEDPARFNKIVLGFLADK